MVVFGGKDALEVVAAASAVMSATMGGHNDCCIEVSITSHRSCHLIHAPGWPQT